MTKQKENYKCFYGYNFEKQLKKTSRKCTYIYFLNELIKFWKISVKKINWNITNSKSFKFRSNETNLQVKCREQGKQRKQILIQSFLKFYF